MTENMLHAHCHLADRQIPLWLAGDKCSPTLNGHRAFISQADLQDRSATRSLTTYDFVFFDHSPSYSAVTETVLLVSEEILIPCELAPYAVTGLLEMISKLTETLQGLDHEIDIQGIIPFKLDQRYAMTELYLTSLRKRFGDLVVPSVRTDSTISRAQSLSQTVFEYDPRSKAVEDFTALATLLLRGKRVQI